MTSWSVQPTGDSLFLDSLDRDMLTKLKGFWGAHQMRQATGNKTWERSKFISKVNFDNSIHLITSLILLSLIRRLHSFAYAKQCYRFITVQYLTSAVYVCDCRVTHTHGQKAISRRIYTALISNIMWLSYVSRIFQTYGNRSFLKPERDKQIHSLMPGHFKIDSR